MNRSYNDFLFIQNWKRFSRLGTLTLLFWVAESIYFNLVEGWHWKATSEAEKRCDTIVGWMTGIAAFLLFNCLLQMCKTYLSWAMEDPTAENTEK